MLIQPNEINKVLSVTGNEITKRGKKYFEQSRVRQIDLDYTSPDEFEAKAKVEGTLLYDVFLSKKQGVLSYECDCPAAQKLTTPCKHVIAMLFDVYINGERYMEASQKRETKPLQALEVKKPFVSKVSYQTPQDTFLSYYENLEMGLVPVGMQDIKMIPRLELAGLNNNLLILHFKMGKEKLYLLKDVYAFSQAMLEGKVERYGKELEFKHQFSSFTEDSLPLVKFITSYGERFLELNTLSSYGINMNKSYKNAVILKNSTLDQFFEIMKDKKIVVENNEYDTEDTGMIEWIAKDPTLEFNVVENDNVGLNIMLSTNEFKMYQGQMHTYMLLKNKIYQCSDLFKEKVVPLLEEMEHKRTNCLKIASGSATSFCEYLIPNLSQKAKVNIPEEILVRHRAEKLGTKIYLDVDSHSNIIAKVKFCYGDQEFNPFDGNAKITCNRNKIAETGAKALLQKYHFLVNTKKGYLYLTNEDDIYTFITEGIQLFMQKFEVLVTEKLKNRQIINTKSFNMGVRIQNDLLEIEVEGLSLSEEELREIFKRYHLKKKYFRLRDGSFLNIENSGIDTLSHMSEHLAISEKELASGHIALPKYRAVYLDQLLRQSENIVIEKENSFKDLIHDIKEMREGTDPIPASMEKILRPYQKTGFQWLKTLDKYHLGGILADDMGLGKTIQMIALLIDQKEKNLDQKQDATTSLVVCPSSLAINWEKEIKKFAPTIEILVVSGNAKEREQQIQNIHRYDVAITSYDLLKRDIELYKKVSFQYAIADEAQYIKNNNTKNARALKKIQAATRFALTGTPMENSLSELWSIFDFVMPGYLFSYKRFKEDYENLIVKEEDKEALEKLQKLVAPFVLRRVKKEVLKELPDKTESIMYSKMEEEQEELYRSYLQQAKLEMQAEFEENGFEKSRMKVLALITRLRQLCCHPSLFVENYAGDSAKLNQCMQIMEDAIGAGHKILLFSGFTSMFDIIAKELEKRGITYQALTGKTKVDTRVEMVDEFNASHDTKVFLISLKAGGTGLNLTGADMVIHYDPWWNLSAQNQATDRAYRMGQKNNVQVFKLIAQNTIEEKILNLQAKKSELTNSVISEKETFISKMSQKEILDLFDM